MAEACVEVDLASPVEMGLVCSIMVVRLFEAHLGHGLPLKLQAGPFIHPLIVAWLYSRCRCPIFRSKRKAQQHNIGLDIAERACEAKDKSPEKQAVVKLNKWLEKAKANGRLAIKL